jgi:TusA-related sulfurtransferase
MVTFDLRETLIPFSLLQITNAFRRMQSGDELEILAGASDVDLTIFREVLQILPRTEYEVISQGEVSGIDAAKLLKLRKISL